MRRRILSLTLALTMVLALLPTPALAYDEFDIKDGVLKRYRGDSKHVTIPDSVTSIGVQAFYDCKKLTSVTIPDSVTSIEGFAFCGCEKLTSVTIPNSVTSIGGAAFSGCEKLTSIEVGEGNSVYSSQEGVLFNKEKTELLAYPEGKAGDYAIPAGVTSLAGTFDKCEKLTSVTIPDSVTSIGEYTFYCCYSLASVTIPDNVTSIGGNAFGNCKSLTSVTIPDSVTSIGGGAFRDCGLTSVTIPASLRFMGESAFNECDNLYSVVFEEGATVISNGAFFGCGNLTDVQIPDTVTQIGDLPFTKCPWLYSGEGGWRIVSGHLLGYGGTDSIVTVPKGVVTINGAFWSNENITEVTLPDTVTRIGWAAFENCPNLKRLNVPASVQKIDYDVYWDSFYESPNLVIHCPPGSYTDTTLPKEKYTVITDLPWTAPKSAYASNQSVLVDGKKVEFQMYALKDADGHPTNYVKLRDVAAVLNGTAAQFEVGWNNGVDITKGKPYTPNGSEMKTPFSGDRVYETPKAQTRVNGSPANLDAIVLTDDQGGQYTYYKLRDLGAALGFKVDWSGEKGIFIETK